MDITLEISTEAAQALHHLSPENSASLELQTVAQQLGVTLQPMHPGIDDSELIKSFYVEVSTENEAESIIGAFLSCPAIEGAYVKPEGEPP
jgi:hypothetical protein